MSAARKQLRKIRRRYAMKGITDETAQKTIDAINSVAEARREETRKIAPDIAENVLSQLKKEYLPDLRAKVSGEMLVLVLAFEHIDRHHTGAWLRKWIREFNTFADDMKRGKVEFSELEKILLDERKFDVAAEFAECCKTGGE